MNTTRRAILGVGVAGLAAPALRAQPARRAPITIVINQSPWFEGFRRVVEMYERETGNRVSLDVNPFAGSLEKQRNSVRSRDGIYDILVLNGLWYQEFYHGGFLTALTDIDASFRLEPGIITYDNTVFWNEATKSHDPNGKIIAVPINGNIPVLYYRADLYEQHRLQVPDTWDQLLENAKRLHNPPQIYGMLQRGARSASDISYDWWPYFNSFNGKLFRDEPNGDFTVTLNSPEGKAALDFYVQLAREAGHPQVGGQMFGQLIQNLVSGRGAHAATVIAIWGQLDDPQRSAVVGKIGVARIPRAANGRPAPTLGHWLGGIPRNVPRERQQAALAFLNWFQTYDVQRRYTEAGSPPVHQRVLESELAREPRYRWMRALAESSPYMRVPWTVPQGAQIVAVLELRLNQVMLGEATPSAGLNTAAAEIERLMREAGHRTGKLPDL
jgi:multiple sugar transport system substrate-binding protein